MGARIDALRDTIMTLTETVKGNRRRNAITTILVIGLYLLIICSTLLVFSRKIKRFAKKVYSKLEILTRKKAKECACGEPGCECTCGECEDAECNCECHSLISDEEVVDDYYEE